jgi:hypothetical protein
VTPLLDNANLASPEEVPDRADPNLTMVGRHMAANPGCQT